MKNGFLLMCILVVIVFFTGCIANDGNTNNDSDETLIEENISVVGDESAELYNIYESIKVAELHSGVILYFGERNSLFIQDIDYLIVLEKYFSSYPEFSPNNKLFAYIDSVEFELIGNLHIYDIDTGENIQKTRLDYSQSDTVKTIEWLNDEHIFLIIGYAFGTASYGGDLYCYDLSKDTLELIIDAPLDIPITDVKLKDDKIILTKLIWTDDMKNEYETFDEEVIIDELL